MTGGGARSPEPVRVILAIGSNRCHGRHGRPRQVVEAAARALEAGGVADMALSPVMESAPVGPSRRRFANAVLAGTWLGTERALLDIGQGLEREFGRRRGRRWGERVLDVDIIAFGDRSVRQVGLQIPHPIMATRAFVLQPMLRVAPEWRHPHIGLSVRHMAARLARRRPLVDLSQGTA